MIPAIQQNYPPPEEPVVDRTQFQITQPWRFLFLALYNRTGGANGIALTAGTFTAAGSGQATATELTNDINSISGSGGGVLQTLQPGQMQMVFNTDPANSINIYPALGQAINALGVNAAFSLAAGKMQFFVCTADNQLLTISLG